MVGNKITDESINTVLLHLLPSCIYHCTIHFSKERGEAGKAISTQTRQEMSVRCGTKIESISQLLFTYNLCSLELYCSRLFRQESVGVKSIPIQENIAYAVPVIKRFHITIS